MSDHQPFVPTDAVRAAIEGREQEVLDALGIAWREGRPHITCPYSGHDDANPSWRWDRDRARAYCTCIPGSHSIYDVVSELRDLDFEGAKIFVAEAIEQPDLVRARRLDGRFIRSDPQSLLAPPDPCRDDSLIPKYLAYRLGIEPDDVLLPRTPFAGWNELPYHDPPKSAHGNAKPIRAGDYPCAVFGTVAADGGRHALRIYLAPNGAGKADLELDSEGRPRTAKKSAKATKGDNTAGRAVQWGDPTRAPWIVLCEGIETGAAIAHALETDIRNGEVAVAAAISAIGIETFQPYPATRRITVAADRDDGK